MNAQTAYYWRDTQDAMAATAAAIQAGNTLSLEFQAYRMLEKMFSLLAHLNGAVYSGFAAFSTQLEQLELVPEGFEQLSQQIVSGQFYAAADLRRHLAAVSDDFGAIMDSNDR